MLIHSELQWQFWLAKSNSVHMRYNGTLVIQTVEYNLYNYEVYWFFIMTKIIWFNFQFQRNEFQYQNISDISKLLASLKVTRWTHIERTILYHKVISINKDQPLLMILFFDSFICWNEKKKWMDKILMMNHPESKNLLSR